MYPTDAVGLAGDASGFDGCDQEHDTESIIFYVAFGKVRLPECTLRGLRGAIDPPLLHCSCPAIVCYALSPLFCLKERGLICYIFPAFIGVVHAQV